MNFGEFCVKFGKWAEENKVLPIGVYNIKDSSGWIFSTKPLNGNDKTFYKVVGNLFNPEAITEVEFNLLRSGSK